MALPIELISTDFDGTLHADFEDPPVAPDLEQLIKKLQGQGTKWVINTGRDLSSLMESVGRARLSIRPDYVVVVEREIYELRESQYLGLRGWNDQCSEAHMELFGGISSFVPELKNWINSRFKAILYEDNYSPLCLIAENNSDADAIHQYLTAFAAKIPDLAVVRNDVYARFSHTAFNKGTALQEIARRHAITTDKILAAGDHLNDLPMLRSDVARWLVAPMNAIPEVKQHVLEQGGYVSRQSFGWGVARGLEKALGEFVEESNA